MTASADGGAPAAPKWRAAARVVGAIAAGMLAQYLAMAVMVLPLVLVGPRRLETVPVSVFLFVGLAMMALLCFFGGAVARWAAGPRLWPDWIGAASVVVAWGLPYVLPRAGWQAYPSRGWRVEGPILSFWGHFSVGWVIFNVTINGLFLLAAAWLARGGDRWAARRLGGRRQPPPPAQEAGG